MAGTGCNTLQNEEISISHFSVKALLTTLFQVITALGMREEYLGCNSEASIKNQLNSSQWILSSCLFSSGFCPAQEEFRFSNQCCQTTRLALQGTVTTSLSLC